MPLTLVKVNLDKVFLQLTRYQGKELQIYNVESIGLWFIRESVKRRSKDSAPSPVRCIGQMQSILREFRC